ncbi:DNA primase DnaG [Candidatus Marsarchaeota archaeon]|nr:DNA primase DnaG [Candidatus Marsarchaeota archaeon]
MAKTYLEIVKYMVEAKFNIDGLVDKPDIIGAVFGQTEGLLGNELDLRELQKNGKIGRIEIAVNQSSNKTFGKLHLPASLDRIETCILAAAVESVDRVGPYEAQFSVDKVEDTRSEKRRKILQRAKELVKKLLDTEIPDSKEISEMVQSDVRASEITEYGPEKLSAGPEIASNEELIIVEGRADVLNLLRNDIAYAIAVGGAQGNIPKTIVDLTSQKETTLFVDGDRGGDMIARSILNVAEVDFIAKAPDGKEVEDLTRKEIIKALRTRIPTDQYRVIGGSAPQQQVNRFQNSRREQQAQREQQEAARPAPQVAERRPERPASQPAQSQERQDLNSIIADEPEGPIPKIDSKSYEPASKLKQTEKQEAANPILEAQVLSQISGGLDELSGTLRSRFYDSSGNVTKEIPIRELLSEMDYSSGTYAVVLDGVITQRLVELALQKNIKAIYGIKANPLTRKFHDILLHTKEQGKIS